MGLDMYLEKMPRYRGVTAKRVSAIESYLEWVKAKEENSKYANCTFKEWCGYDFNDLPSIKVIEFYRQFFKCYYSDWDDEKKYPHYRIMEQVGYWRKANAIHEWFVQRVQDGVDDCRYHHEVTKEILEELLDTCTEVLNSCKKELSDGRIIANRTLAMELLPTQGGFFFGSTDYDEYYIQDIENTIYIVQKALETTDFDKEMIYYISSW